ncbi:MAG: UPF0175 family protein [Archaeoglobaceae archaeon]
MNELWVTRGLEKVFNVNPKRLEEFINYLKKDREFFEEIVISAYVDGVISLSKAAELLEVTRDELAEDLKRKGVPIRKLSKEDVLAEVDIAKF